MSATDIGRAAGAGYEGGDSTIGGALASAAEQALADRVAGALLPADGESQADRDTKDAKHADFAFGAILTATGAVMETPTMVAGILADIGSAGTSAGAHTAVQSAITAALLAVRALWARLSFHDRAKIWRGEL